MSNEKLFTATEAAKILGVSRATLNRRIRAGRIEVHRTNREGKRPSYVVPESSILAFTK